VEVQASTAATLFTATVPNNGVRTNIYVTEPNGTVYRLAAASTQDIISVAPLRATREYTNYNTFPLPDAVEQIQFWQGRMWVSQYFADEDTSVIWFSKPFAFHLYGMGEDFLVVPGRVSMMLWCNQGLLIGSTQLIFLRHEDGKLEQLTSYGVVPGVAGDLDAESMAYFWTTRGFCKAMPFENLTEKAVGMAPGLWASTRLVYLEGMQQVVTITQGGGTPFNARSSI
jgi:hypothetical protein